MHLSLLSETPATHHAVAGERTNSRGRAHRDGLVRGIVFLAAISIPLCLAIVTGHARLADASAGYAQSFDAQR